MANALGIVTMVKNNIIVGIILLFSMLTTGKASMATKFDWLATESAPKIYPMVIIQGYLFFPEEGRLYVPNKKTLHHGWGKGVSIHLVGDDTKPLPERLEITFFSYTENQFYQGTFKLPYEKILKLFQTSYYSPKVNKNTTYKEVVVGVAPGGHVSVWIHGFDKTIEVFSGQAKKIEGDWSDINNNPKFTREEYIERRIDESLKPEELKEFKEKGVPIGLWETYRKRYDWQPIFTGLEAYSLIDRITYFNGEEEYLNYPLDAENTSHARTIPKEMVFDWEWPKGRPLVFKLFFDEAEIFDAFNTLGSNGEPLKLEMRMLENDKNETLFSVLLKNSKEEIFLKKTDLKNYGIPKKVAN